MRLCRKSRRRPYRSHLHLIRKRPGMLACGEWHLKKATYGLIFYLSPSRLQLVLRCYAPPDARRFPIRRMCISDKKFDSSPGQPSYVEVPSSTTKKDALPIWRPRNTCSMDYARKSCFYWTQFFGTGRVQHSGVMTNTSNPSKIKNLSCFLCP